MKAIINDRSTKEEATQVIDDITEFSTMEESLDQHYFLVKLEGVSNLNLLNKDNVYRYLSMVAPVGFKKGFIYKSKIHEKARELNIVIDEYSIFLNEDQVFKNYGTKIYDKHRKPIDDVYDISFYDIICGEELIAWGWYGISKFEKVIPAANIARGIRLRKGNIQIGSENTLVKLFKEPRGINYFFGEVHAVSPDLIPNARRDYFLENETTNCFEKLLRNNFDILHKLYYFSSQIRSEQRKIDDFLSFSEKFKRKTELEGFTNKKQIKEYEDQFEEKKKKAKKAKIELVKATKKAKETSSAHQRVLQEVIKSKGKEINSIGIPNTNSKPKFIADDISTLSRKERRLVSKIFEVINEVLIKELSDDLIAKIKEELNK